MRPVRIMAYRGLDRAASAVFAGGQIDCSDGFGAELSGGRQCGALHSNGLCTREMLTWYVMDTAT
jgi:hypothetical protein